MSRNKNTLKTDLKINRDLSVAMRYHLYKLGEYQCKCKVLKIMSRLTTEKKAILLPKEYDMIKLGEV
jgi:hypothetical protein